MRSRGKFVVVDIPQFRPVDGDVFGLRPGAIAAGEAPVVLLCDHRVGEHPRHTLRAIGVKHLAGRAAVQMRAVKVFGDCPVDGLAAGDVLFVRCAPCLQFAGLARIGRAVQVDRRISLRPGVLHFSQRPVERFPAVAVGVYVVFAAVGRQAQEHGIFAAIHAESVAVVFVRDFADAMTITISAQGLPAFEHFVKRGICAQR